MPDLDGHSPEGLYRVHFTSLVRAVALMGVADPEDVVVEAFIRLLETYDRIREPKAAAGYLRRTVINLASNRLRSHRVEQAALTRFVTPTSQDPMLADNSTALTILELPLRARQVLVLRYWLDLPDDEIAHYLSIRTATVRTHLSAARAKLRQQLSASEDTP